MKWVVWYYPSLVPGRPVLKVISRDLWNPPLVAGMEPIDCEVIEVPDDTVLHCPGLR
jgi:hypothetical protein